MYLFGIIVALLMAWLFKKTLLKSATPMLIMELPPYKHPVPHVVLRHMCDRSKMFLRRAGTIILGINIILWFLATYPKNTIGTARFEAQRFETLKVVKPEMTPSETAQMIVQLRAATNRKTKPAMALPKTVSLNDAERVKEQLDQIDKE